jgi:hypothetical protein
VLGVARFRFAAFARPHALLGRVRADRAPPALALLFLEHGAVQVGFLRRTSTLTVRAALLRGELDFLLRLALQRDLARRRVLDAAVRAAQVREQLHLRVVADDVIALPTLMPASSSCVEQRSTGTFRTSAN